MHILNHFSGHPTYHPEYTTVHPLLCAVCSCPLWWGHSQLQKASGRTEWWGHSCPLPHLPPPPAYMSAGCHLGAGTWQQPYAYLWCTQWMQLQSCMGCLTQQLSYGSVLTCNKMGHITCQLHEDKFYILVTIHLGIILINNQLDTKFLPDLHTGRSPTQSDINQMLYWYNWLSWWWAQGCPKHVENQNKYI